MNTAFIMLAQTKGGATLEILFLLFVAAIIAYITAWLYYKSVYEKRLKEIETDKHNLNMRIINLNGEIVALQKSLADKDHEMELYIIEDIVQHKHLIDYKRIGVATSKDKDDLTMISGIGPVIERRLNYLDIYTFQQISKFTLRDVEVIDDTIIYFSGRIDRDGWVVQAIELVHSEEHRVALFKRIGERKNRIAYDRLGKATREEADDLRLISGIGGWIRDKLNILDIYTFRQISNFTEDDIAIVTEAIEYFPGRIERDEWIYQAAEFVRIAGDKEALLKRIRERKDRIVYDRLGVAHRIRANNLTMINGLGLWVEERLNALDIYTFDQISKLTHADIETITEILEIKPGRIEKDNWVAQAGKLAKLQHQRESI
jgi:predicted flap endonuclease-1-like 5' DNA nuclease